QRTGDVVADGDVVYTEPGRTVRAQRLDYNIDTRQVRGEQTETVNQGVILRAREVAGNQTRLTAVDASITACDLPRPHYRFTARSVVLIPNDRVIARHVGVWLLGTRL